MPNLPEPFATAALLLGTYALILAGPAFLIWRRYYAR